jgi:hypothetical protein
MFDTAKQAEPSAINPAFVARQVAAFSDDDMSTFVKAFEASKRGDSARVGVNQAPTKEVEAPGVQKWLVLCGERTNELFQEIYTLENELRPLLRVTTVGGDCAAQSTPDPFLVVDSLSLHHNAVAAATTVVRSIRHRLQL